MPSGKLPPAVPAAAAVPMTGSSRRPAPAGSWPALGRPGPNENLAVAGCSLDALPVVAAGCFERLVGARAQLVEHVLKRRRVIEHADVRNRIFGALALDGDVGHI